MANLVIGRRLVRPQFEPVERRFAGHRRAVLAVRDQLAGQHRHDRVVPQLVVIDDIFIAQRNAKEALADHCRHRMLDQLLRAAVAETPRKPIDQPDRLVRCPQQQTAGIRGDLAAIKSSHYGAPLDACKSEQIRVTLCLHRDSP